jgi:uncharacterized protein (TIGR04562 family)
LTEIENPYFQEKWRFPWPIMDVMIGGKSSIDLGHLYLRDWEQATRFVICYGFNPDVPKDARFIHAVIVEAVHFIQHYLVPAELRGSVSMPDEVRNCQDVRRLLLYASDLDPENRRLQVWSCSVLRVMHTIAHIEGVTRLAEHKQAFKQIYESFNRYIQYSESGTVFFGEGQHVVELEKVEWKRQKSRESVILKLLHKPANVAETIYDIIGLRIVTKRLCDVLVVVKYLRQMYLVSFPNCNPTRARNSLLDVDRFRDNLESILQMVETGRLRSADIDHAIDKLTTPLHDGSTAMSPNNPHTSLNYRAIQLTCRQMVKTRGMHQDWIDKFRATTAKEANPDLCTKTLTRVCDLLEQWSHESLHSHSAFFPFEVQIMDKDSYHLNLSGDASHDRYKWSQIRLARRRVLSEVLKL